MPEKRQQRKTGAGGGGGKSTTRGARAGAKGKEKGVDLADLGKAGEHLIMSATELVVGAGFVIKGVKSLLQDEQGRKLLRELPFKAVNKGFDLAKKAGEEYRAKKRAGSKSSRSERGRKINVD